VWLACTADHGLFLAHVHAPAALERALHPWGVSVHA
jgi:hypothetical protein